MTGDYLKSSRLQNNIFVNSSKEIKLKVKASHATIHRKLSCALNRKHNKICAIFKLETTQSLLHLKDLIQQNRYFK